MRQVWMGAVVSVVTMMACGRSEAPVERAAPPPVVPTAPAATPGEAPPAAAPAEDPAKEASKEAKVEEPAEATAKAGKIKLVHKQPSSKRMRELAKDLQESKLFAELVAELDKTLILPRDLAIHFEDCGEINAFYDPEEKQVSMCWELLEYTVEQFSKEAKSEDEAAAGFLNATLFTFFHELGHALVDLLDLPITGKEEDVVDQLATWFLLDGGEEGALMALDGALSFLQEEGEEEGDDEPAVWGEHSLDQQRFYNIVCWVYGSNPDKFGELLEGRGGPLPAERAEICPDEWQRMSSAWSRLLAEHVRE